ncbi:anti-FecI sigma factor, FecR [Pseudopedobacter saltans DSM 12145]|uniref:Anti-FecI sigma factor, FecR n=1 Tax=Pseudopedobacter saltans (strain ATCC 51119 / DSM 12145 / JCM 21818 / CCUG 39354 / LMG 10337 / NBRC 100064 / NCIMB 13643) TaxID=762903 RepID=F0SE12_PSESL|nr:FecR domain-containing protein [Pseudopedobacter saltans]ADY52938.1 anti-FecI sigma factor, FecR [Pseudopedobacter saltans DSM 12145]
MNREKNISALEKLLSKYFEAREKEHDSLEVSYIDFDQERSMQLIHKRVAKKRYIRFNWLAAACVLVCLGTTFFFLNRKIHNINLVTEETSFGEVKHVILSDGTKVWLNAKSEFRYPKVFSGNRREVFLDGEAYFEVKRDEKKPFTIISNGIKTTVLGTSFNINSYKNAMGTKVSVVSGKVSVEKENKQVYLEKNQQGFYNAKTDGLSKLPVDASSLSSWKDGRLEFNHVGLNEVIATIQRNFSQQVKVADNLKNCEVSADFTDMELEKIMKILSEVVGGRYERKGDTFYLSGTGCN